MQLSKDKEGAVIFEHNLVINIQVSRIETILAMLADSPADNFLQHALALEYIKEGDEQRALSLFGEILTRDPGYIGSYYHLAKLLEKNDRAAEAIRWYEKGMEAAQKAGDQHAYSELKSAYEELTF